MALEKIRLRDLTEKQADEITENHYLIMDSEDISGGEVVKIQLSQLMEYIRAHIDD